MLFTQPRQDLGITAAQRVEIVPERREDDHIGVFQAAVDRHDYIAEAFYRFAIRADQARFERRRQAMAQLFAITQAGHMEKILGLHEGVSENPVNGQDADAPQGRGDVLGHNSTFVLFL